MVRMIFNFFYCIHLHLQKRYILRFLGGEAQGIKQIGEISPSLTTLQAKLYGPVTLFKSQCKSLSELNLLTNFMFLANVGDIKWMQVKSHKKTGCVPKVVKT